MDRFLSRLHQDVSMRGKQTSPKFNASRRFIMLWELAGENRKLGNPGGITFDESGDFVYVFESGQPTSAQVQSFRGFDPVCSSRRRSYSHAGAAYQGICSHFNTRRPHFNIWPNGNPGTVNLLSSHTNFTGRGGIIRQWACRPPRWYCLEFPVVELPWIDLVSLKLWSR